MECSASVPHLSQICLCCLNFAEDIDVQDAADAGAEANATEDIADMSSDLLSNGQQQRSAADALKSSPSQQKSAGSSSGSKGALFNVFVCYLTKFLLNSLDFMINSTDYSQSCS